MNELARVERCLVSCRKGERVRVPLVLWCKVQGAEYTTWAALLKQSGCLTASLAACFNFIFKSGFQGSQLVQALAWGGDKREPGGRRKGIGYQILTATWRLH